MSLFQRCAGNFDSRDRQRGKDYYRAGAVAILAREATMLRAAVEGSSDYDVQLDWSEAGSGLLFADCSCPRFADVGECKHIVATILAADAEGLGDTVPGRGPLVVESADEAGADQFEDDFDEVARPRPRTGAPRPPVARAPAKPAGRNNRKRRRQPPLWKKQLELVSTLQAGEAAEPTDRLDRDEAKPREIWYVLSISGSRVRGLPIVELWQRETRKDGTPGKLKQARFLPHEIERIRSDEDRALVGLLAGNERGLEYEASYYGYRERKLSEFVITPAMFEIVFPRLAASRRFGWLPQDEQGAERQIRLLDWDDGPPWRPALSVARAEDKPQWQVDVKLAREGQSAELNAARLILDVGLIVFDGRMVRFEAAGAMAWLTMIRETGPVRVPVQQGQELVEQLAKSPSGLAVELPDELRWEEERPTPLPHLIISEPEEGWRNDLECSLRFHYDNYSVPWGEGDEAWYDRGLRRLVRRDRAAESAALEQLIAAGARRIAGYRYGEPARLWVTPASMPGLVQRMVGLGWRVEAAGRPIRRPGTMSLSVTSGVDWFDLEGVCDFDGVSAPLPVVLAALRKGERFVTLGDGSQGMLPEDWLARFGGLADLGEAKKDRIRFLPTQAALLDALLAAQEQPVAVDEAFARLRKKLRSFEGIAARVESDSFAGTLRQYQREGLGWLHFLDEFGFGGCLADDMGLGKTIQVLALLEGRRARRRRSRRLKEEASGPSLVIVPRSLVFNWIEEARRFAPRLRVLNYTGLDRAAAREQFDESDLVVTTYGALRRDIAQFRERQFDFVILDEAQAIKNASSQSAKCCRLLPARRRLAMTGTPVENHLGELWSLFEFLNPGMLGRSAKLTQLLDRRRGKRPDSVTSNGKPAEYLSLLARALRPFMLRRTKQQVLSELPEKTEQTLYCELASGQRKLYDELRDHYRATLLQRVGKMGMNKSKIHVLEALLRLRQAACHPGLLDKKAADAGSAKLDTLLEQLAEVNDEGHKALVFSQFTSLLAIVRRQLDERGVVYEYLDGKTTDRQSRVERFQTDPACRLFLISLKAGGQGLNLTAADYVFILDPWWNPAVEAQAVDRAHRLGQMRRVFAYRLIARDTVEEKILELQQEKRQLAEAIISADAGLLRNLTCEDLQLLLS